MITLLDNLTIDKYKRKQLDELTPNNKRQCQVIVKTVLDRTVDDTILHQVSKLAYFNDVCAGALLATQKDGLLVVEQLAILPAYQKQGLGTMLWKFAVETAQQKDLALQVLATPSSLEWFIQKGMIQKEQEDGPFGPVVRLVE